MSNMAKYPKDMSSLQYLQPTRTPAVAGKGQHRYYCHPNEWEVSGNMLQVESTKDEDDKIDAVILVFEHVPTTTG